MIWGEDELAWELQHDGLPSQGPLDIWFNKTAASHDITIWMMGTTELALFDDGTDALALLSFYYFIVHTKLPM